MLCSDILPVDGLKNVVPFFFFFWWFRKVRYFRLISGFVVDTQKEWFCFFWIKRMIVVFKIEMVPFISWFCFLFSLWDMVWIWKYWCLVFLVSLVACCCCSGYPLLRDPHFNKGLAFSEKERDAHYLRGLLPPVVVSQQLQVLHLLYPQTIVFSINCDNSFLILSFWHSTFYWAG